MKPERYIIKLSFFVLLLIFLACQSSYKTDFPASAKKPVVDKYHEVSVTDNYRWLEDFDNPEVKEWNENQNEYARSILDNISYREDIKRRLTKLFRDESVSYYGVKYEGGIFFAYKSVPQLEQDLLVTFSSIEDLSTEKVIVDVNELDPEATTSIDFYVPSHDGKLAAVSLSEKGSEIGTVYIYEVATGNRLGDIIPRVNGPTAGGDVAWKIDNSGFYYTHYPRQGERPDEDLSFYQQVYYHKLGTPTEEDSYAVGEEFPRIAEIELDVSDDGKYFIATVSDGDGGEYAHYLLGPTGKWVQITKFKDFIPTVKFAPDNSLFLLSRKDAPKGKLLHLSARKTNLTKARTVVAESNLVIKYFLPTENYLYIIDMDGGPQQLRVVDYNGKPQKEIPAKPISSFNSMVSLRNDNIIFRNYSYTEPPAWYKFNPSDWKINRTELYKTSPADFKDINVTREFATSKDGTRVPVNIMIHKDTNLDGNNPTILYAYGAYGISRSPKFYASLQLWMEQGGIYVEANLRGGGEYGEEWHLAGNLTNKQNVFDDFVACAEYLIDKKYTNQSKLVIWGGSNGGLLMGAAFTQHPELFRTVISSVGIYDMLRVELDPNGEFNITEFGTVKNPDHFKALYAYSPYHNVKDGTEYPSILFLTGQHDGRVNPYQSRKMTAILQETGTKNPVLLRTNAKTGHGGGTALSEKIEKNTDIYSFIFDQLNLNYKYDH